MAVWTYFRGGERYTGDLEGNNFSIAFEDGWIWIIPLRGERYSVGVVTDKGNARQVGDRGPDGYLSDCLRRVPLISPSDTETPPGLECDGVCK